MSFWLNDPALFLYTKGTGSDDVYLWRCKKTVSSSSSLVVVPMKPEDFEYVSNVNNHLELIGDLFDWDETDYKRLVEFIFKRRLLVNSQGLVIAELYKVDKEGNKMIDEEVPAIYIRSLDVLALKSYIPKLREQPIPLRTVQVLKDVDGKTAVMEDVDGKTAVMEKDFNVTKLTARVDHLEAENIRLESKNNTLDTKVTELTARVANLEAENTKLKSKNNTLDTSVTKLTADMVTQMNALATLQIKVDRLNKEVWMNDLTNSGWVGIEELRGGSTYDNIVIVGPQGTFTTDDNSTNVRAIYWCKIKTLVPGLEYKGICLEELTPNKEKARFLEQNWMYFILNGKTYVHRRL